MSEALRKLAKHRSQLEKALVASAACKARWEHGVEFFRAIEEESKSAASVN